MPAQELQAWEPFLEQHSGQLLTLVLAALVLGTLLVMLPQLLRWHQRNTEMQHTEHMRIIANLKRHGVDLYNGHGSFVDAHAVRLENRGAAPVNLTGDHVLIATGSHPFRPPVFPFHDARVYDSDTILNLHDIPREMVVVGGGVIGCEYACMFSALGIQVTDLLGPICRLDLPDCLGDSGQNLLVLDALEVPLEAPPEGDVQGP